MLRRGLAYLVNRVEPLDADADGRSARSHAGAPMIDADEVPGLWHDKDLYAPLAIVRAAVLAAVHLVQARLVGQRVPPRQPWA